MKLGRLTTVATATVLTAVAVAAHGQDTVRLRSSLEEASSIAAQLRVGHADPVSAALVEVDEARFALDDFDRLRSSSLGKVEGNYERALGRYVESILNLGLTPEPETASALDQALSDDRAIVRRAALLALREGAARDGAILDTVRSLVERDSDPENRRQAFEVYSRWGDEDDLLALSIRIGRSGGPLQEAAVREWVRIESERLELAGGDPQLLRGGSR